VSDDDRTSPPPEADPLPWPLPLRTDLRDRLLDAWATGRGYHDTRHLTEVLDRIGELGGSGNTELVLAAWFHDAVYDGAPAAEERSARLTETELAATDVHVAEVARLVRLTEHHDPAPGDHNGELLCDADLAVLAAPPERYREYAAGVREEYAAYSDEDFRAGRLAVLEELAAREHLFATPYAREHWEPRARVNLLGEIEELRAGR
jgi:predicted metal-dependent HD superfamily phosphohydrolase